MEFFVLFILLAMMLGSGAMLAPAWRTDQPRIGLAATLCFALITGGAVFWTYAFGWDTLVIDYLLFGLMSFVVLGGTLSSAQARAEAQGDILDDADMGWTTRTDLAFFGVITLAAMAVMVFSNTDSLTNLMHITQHTVDTGTFTGDDAPALHALSAYLSQQLNIAVGQVYRGLGAALVVFIVWGCFDLGHECNNKQLAYGLAICGAFVAILLQWRDAYILQMGFVFGIAFVTYGWRFYRHGMWWDMLAAGLLLGAVLFVNHWVFFALIVGHYFVLLTLLFVRPSIQHDRLWHVGMWVGIVGVMLVATAPYVFSALN